MTHRDATIHRDAGSFFIGGFVLREVADIASRVVREVSGNAELLLGVGSC